MIFILLLGLMFWANAYDSYHLSGQFDHSVIYQYQNMLLIREVKSLYVESQPKIPQLSYISDISNRDCILVLKPKTTFVVKQVDSGVLVNCYDSNEPVEPFSILLDAGHGGKDPGAIAKSGIKEKDVVLGFVQMMKNRLTKRFGHQILLTREKDVYLDKYQRLEKVLELKPQLLISVHADAFFTPDASGFGALYLKDGEGSIQSRDILNNYSAKPSDSMRLASKGFAQHILNDLHNHYHLHNRLPTPEALVILRSPWSESVLLELGFLSNPVEAKKLANTEYITQLVNDVVNSIEGYVLKKYGIIKIGTVD